MRAAGGVCVRLPDFSLSRFGAVNIVDRKRIQPEEIISAYEFEFYTDDYSGGTLTDGTFRPARKRYYNLYRPGQRQQLVPPYKCYYLNIVTQDPELCDFLDHLPDSGMVWNMDAVVELLRDMMETQEKNALEGRLWIQSGACRILSLLASQRLTEEPADRGAFLHRKKLMAVDRYIRDNLSEDLSLERLAEISSLDPTYFHKLYTSAYGKTPAQRVLMYRITAAKIALVENELSLSEIAARCGFSSHSYFSSKFKQVTGKSPTQYRDGLLDRRRK